MGAATSAQATWFPAWLAITEGVWGNPTMSHKESGSASCHNGERPRLMSPRDKIG
jgi:hypothetical protein